ncbi:TIGR00341 family protein [Kaarinaea lacus]
MKYIEIIADAGNTDTIAAIAEKAEAIDFRSGITGDDNVQQSRILVNDDKLQPVLDTLQNTLGTQEKVHIVVLPVETSLPKQDKDRDKQESSAIATREALIEEATRNTRLNLNFLILVFLSTIVAAIGLIENNVAVVIGAMVIAPLLGPNLALSLGTALGDINLVKKSISTLLSGITLAVLLAAVIGNLWPDTPASPELMARTVAGLDSAVLALASGAAAALSLTTGLSSVLVGVMVAVALLPPATTLGIMLGQANYGLAIDAGLLLAINIVCVNLASKIVFFMKGVRPRTSHEKARASRRMIVYILGWIIALLILMLAIYAEPSFL